MIENKLVMKKVNKDHFFSSEPSKKENKLHYMTRKFHYTLYYFENCHSLMDNFKKIFGGNIRSNSFSKIHGIFISVYFLHNSKNNSLLFLKKFSLFKKKK